ncbi:MAG TPA: valine--tRNA ligase, partial [Candidatus Latescibacteria bacterium]|nr:valine--tRNA ligase [Candidatus Latescibacterota bacterium]
MEGMGIRYDPKQFEAKWYSFWEEKGYFKADPASPKPNFTVVIPPPNVTDVLHMGHGLNNTLQDILIRKKRMEGHEALWVPGTDHAGIATQNVVERQLASEGKTRWDLGREAFLERVWDWVRRTGGTIIEQLRALGCSCDWSRTRFTLDPGLSRAVREAFVRLYEKGLIYKGKYIVNWCPRCRTALADDEVEHREHDGKLWYIRYPLEGGGHVEVATTRPETMLGDTAVAVNPGDGRYRGIVGRAVVLPLLGRRIPVVADEAVDPEFGTGAVKVTPAHDPADYEVALRHGLPFVVAIDEDGRMTEETGPYKGLDRFQCREKVLGDLRREGLLLKEELHRHSVGHCYRCDTVVEPYLSDQWFVRMRPLAEPALEAVSDGKIRLYPERWTKVYEHWMRNIRDWCISRQLWWGHRIPVWTCPDCG